MEITEDKLVVAPSFGFGYPDFASHCFICFMRNRREAARGHVMKDGVYTSMGDV